MPGTPSSRECPPSTFPAHTPVSREFLWKHNITIHHIPFGKGAMQGTRQSILGPCGPRADAPQVMIWKQRSTAAMRGLCLEQERSLAHTDQDCFAALHFPKQRKLGSRSSGAKCCVVQLQPAPRIMRGCPRNCWHHGRLPLNQSATCLTAGACP